MVGSISDEGLTLETSAFEFLCGGQFTLSTQLIKPKLFSFEDSGSDAGVNVDFRSKNVLRGFLRMPYILTYLRAQLIVQVAMGL